MAISSSTFARTFDGGACLCLFALILGCASGVDLPSDPAPPAAATSTTEHQPDISQKFLPISIGHVIHESGYGIVEAHGIKGGGKFWEFISSDRSTIIEVDANDDSQLTRLRFYVHHAGQKSNLADDLDVIQAHVSRIFPNEQWANSKGLGWAGENQNVPAKIVCNDLALELSRINGNTVLTISPEENHK